MTVRVIANRADNKKNAQKSSNSRWLSGGGVGAKGIVTKGLNWLQS